MNKHWWVPKNIIFAWIYNRESYNPYWRFQRGRGPRDLHSFLAEFRIPEMKLLISKIITSNPAWMSYYVFITCWNHTIPISYSYRLPSSVERTLLLTYWPFSKDWLKKHISVIWDTSIKFSFQLAFDTPLVSVNQNLNIFMYIVDSIFIWGKSN